MGKRVERSSEGRGSNTPHSVLGVIRLGIAPGGQVATACLTQLHPPAFACAVALPCAALGSYSQLSPITLAGWSSLCCTWPHDDLSLVTARLAVSAGKLTPHARRVGKEWGSSSSAELTPATPGPDRPSE